MPMDGSYHMQTERATVILIWWRPLAPGCGEPWACCDAVGFSAKLVVDRGEIQWQSQRWR